MKGLAGERTATLAAAKRIYERKGSFLVVFAFVFGGSVATLAAYDLLPEASRVEIAPIAASSASSTSSAEQEDPLRIEIPTISLSVAISNPTTTAIEALDHELLVGAVRYPTSAKLGETGNVVLFGHSSYLPVVGNQAYKTFNGIQKLVAGDTITLVSSSTEYTYHVRSVAKESAASGAGISLLSDRRVLTLATCNSFGAKSDRFVVTADFVESHSISI